MDPRFSASPGLRELPFLIKARGTRPHPLGEVRGACLVWGFYPGVLHETLISRRFQAMMFSAMAEEKGVDNPVELSQSLGNERGSRMMPSLWALA
jgi:hypothetical protein